MGRTVREALASGKVLLCDGAMGTMLQAGGAELGEAPELLNLESPEHVLAVHRAYAAAGAQIITTNTFGGSRIKLARAGVADRTSAVNVAGARVARQAVAEDVFVAGDIGPTGELLAPYGELEPAEAVAAFAEQAGALAEGGVDLFFIETMSDLAEVRAAVEGIRQVSDLPIFCTMTFDSGGRTMWGVTPAAAAEALSALGVEAFGANCGMGPDGMESVVSEMLAARPQATLIAQPNAGLPSLVDGKAVYSATPETMAEYGRRFAAMGVRVVGSCCGSTPAHTEAIGKAVADYR